VCRSITLVYSIKDSNIREITLKKIGERVTELLSLDEDIINIMLHIQETNELYKGIKLGNIMVDLGLIGLEDLLLLLTDEEKQSVS
jgi:hypothetical protein